MPPVDEQAPLLGAEARGRASTDDGSGPGFPSGPAQPRAASVARA